jgi:glutamyl-Q tRNA(Asp) synthetase
VVVDDAVQGVTHVVRGADLLNSTPRQIYLQQLLGLPTPYYAHVPIATNSKGDKLSKQTLAEPISMSLAGHHLFDALCFLGQNPPAEMQNATLDEMWRWSLNNWSLAKIPHQRELISLKA